MPESQLLASLRSASEKATEWNRTVSLEPEQFAYLIQQIDQERADKQGWLEAYQKKFRFYNDIIDIAMKAFKKIITLDYDEDIDTFESMIHCLKYIASHTFEEITIKIGKSFLE